ncbi:MAG: hypothetical protein AAB439_03260 [Patescibacteria group bacterium]
MSKQRVLLAFGGIVLILVVGMWGWVVFGPVRYSLFYFFTLLNAPQEVKDMLFVVDSDSSSSLVRIRLGGLETQTFEGIHILGVERTNDKTAVLVFQQGSGATNVARVEGDALVPLTDDGEMKKSVAFSSDGAYFAYTVPVSLSLQESDSDSGEVPSISYSPNAFSVQVYERSGAFIESFSGNHPFFLDNETLGFFSEEGIETKNLVKGDKTYIYDDIAFLADERPYFGRNNTMIVRNPVSNELVVFQFISTPPLVYRIAGVLPGSSNGFALSRDDAVYHGFSTDGSFIIQKVTDFEQSPEVFFSIPSSFFSPTSAVF